MEQKRTWQAGNDANLFEITKELPLAIAGLIIGAAVGAERALFTTDKAKKKSSWLGWLFIFLATALSGWTTADLAIDGKGTPIPSQPAQTLVTTGAYSLIRHPMYIGFLLFFFGVCRLFRLKSTLLLTGLFVFYLRQHAQGEEEVLAERYGEKYEAYRAKTPSGLLF